MSPERIRRPSLVSTPFSCTSNVKRKMLSTGRHAKRGLHVPTQQAIAIFLLRGQQVVLAQLLSFGRSQPRFHIYALIAERRPLLYRAIHPSLMKNGVS